MCLTFLVCLPPDLVLLHILLCISHVLKHCSLLSSGPLPPFNSVTVDTWHLETAGSSLVKCWQWADHWRRWKNQPVYSELFLSHPCPFKFPVFRRKKSQPDMRSHKRRGCWRKFLAEKTKYLLGTYLAKVYRLPVAELKFPLVLSLVPLYLF